MRFDSLLNCGFSLHLYYFHSLKSWQTLAVIFWLRSISHEHVNWKNKCENRKQESNFFNCEFNSTRKARIAEIHFVTYVSIDLLTKFPWFPSFSCFPRSISGSIPCFLLSYYVLLEPNMSLNHKG